MDSNALIDGLEKVTGKWCKQRKREERERSARLNRRYAMTRTYRVTVKDAAFQVMKDAYLKASSGGTLPAHARQIMYAARGEILRLTDRDRLDDQYFTQTLLPEFMRERPDLTSSWDVVFDARGHFVEPHAKDRSVQLGTIACRDYLGRVRNHRVDEPEFGHTGGDQYPTYGPQHRYGGVLFCEKEGFMPLFERTGLARRYDLAIMSTKGVSNVAARHLVDNLGVPVYVLHDFDQPGFMIYNTLHHGTKRYWCSSAEVIDLGLRLEDVKKYDLESEPVVGSRISGEKLEEYGATEAEIDFLESARVELNALTSGDLIKWIEAKLDEQGVEKVVPDAETLEDAFRRAQQIRHVEDAIAEAVEQARENSANAEPPDDLEEQVRERLCDDPKLSWDEVISRIADEVL